MVFVLKLLLKLFVFGRGGKHMSLFLEDERKLRESDVTLALSVYIATITQFLKIQSVKVRLYFYFEDFIYVQKKQSILSLKFRSLLNSFGKP